MAECAPLFRPTPLLSKRDFWVQTNAKPGIYGQIYRAGGGRQRRASAPFHLGVGRGDPLALSQRRYRLVFRIRGYAVYRNPCPGELAVGDTYHIAPKTAHLISNRSEADTRFLLVQGVGPYDFRRVGS